MEENQRKITPWKLIKWTLLLLSLLVYAVVFIRLFTACDAKISDDIILTSKEEKDFENLEIDYPLYHYQPTSWTSDDGTVQVKNVYYLEPINELQLTLSYRMSAFKNGKDNPFDFGIRVVDTDETVKSGEGIALYKDDLPGMTLDGTELYTETRFDHKYIRICTPAVTVDNGERVDERVQIVDENGEVTYSTKTTVVGGNKVYLDIYDSDTGELLYSFEVAGKNISNTRARRNKVDIRVID